MAEITKPTKMNLIFASSAPTPNILEPADTKIQSGWVNEKPPYQWENFLERKRDSFSAFMNQHGFPSWDNETEYYAQRSYVLHGNFVWKCIQTHTTAQTPDVGSAYWEVWNAVATQAEVNAGTLNNKYVTPLTLAGRTGTTSRTGVLSLATNTEAAAGTNTAKAVTAAGIAAYVTGQKVTATNDVTVGRLMTIGSNGFGSSTTPVLEGNLDSVAIGVRRIYENTHANALSLGFPDLGLSSSTSVSWVLNTYGTTTRVVVYANAIGQNRTFIRIKEGSAWKDWREIAYDKVSQTEAEAGTSVEFRIWSPQRVRQAVLGWWNETTTKTLNSDLSIVKSSNVLNTLRLANSLHDVSFINGTDGSFGLYSTTKSKWLYRILSDGSVTYSGNIETATKLATARNITVGSSTKSFDGSANISFSASEIGNAVSATVLQTARNITVGATTKSFNGSANIAFTAAEIGNAVSATKLITARTINGVAFDGTANITVADSTKLPLTGGNVTGALSATKATQNHESANAGILSILDSSDSTGVPAIGLFNANNSSGATLQFLRNGNFKLSNDSGTIANLESNLVGNANTATKLQASRNFTINGVSKTFDGSADVVFSSNDIGAIGVDQVYRTVTSSRIFGTAYQNSTGKPIMVMITVDTNGKIFQVSADGTTWIRVANIDSGGREHITFIVPNNWYYRASTTGGEADTWVELRV